MTPESQSTGLKGDQATRDAVVEQRRTYLSSLGFSDKGIERISSKYSKTLITPEVIDAKIAGLKERNFKNPHKMIESSPNILSLAFNNIDRRLRLLNGLVNLYQLPYSSVEMMERGNFMFSTKIDKLLVLARVLKEYQVSEDDLPKTAIKLIFINLENVLVALSQAEEKDDINALFKRITEIKTQDLDRQQKREIIREELDKFPKIVRRYLKGYPN